MHRSALECNQVSRESKEAFQSVSSPLNRMPCKGLCMSIIYASIKKSKTPSYVLEHLDTVNCRFLGDEALLFKSLMLEANTCPILSDPYENLIVHKEWAHVTVAAALFFSCHCRLEQLHFIFSSLVHIWHVFQIFPKHTASSRSRTAYPLLKQFGLYSTYT